MKERPILFSPPMVRALLAGTKTQTRRVLKGTQPWGVKNGRPEWAVAGSEPTCPYGQPGERLWVRESWSPDPPADGTWAYTEWAGCRDGRIASVPERFQHPVFCNYAANWLHGPITWTPSIHMPRWACRLVLEVTEVRVERLQDITEADALAEGIVQLPDGGFGLADGSHYHHTAPRQSYFSLWEAINGPGSVEANPWVWAVSFRKLDARAAAQIGGAISTSPPP